MMSWLFSPAIWASFLTLCVLEIVLGIDNIIFLSIISGRLPREKQHFARVIGLGLALVLRILLLACIAWLSKLNSTVFHAFGQDISWRDMVLCGGGLFLMYKAVSEMHAEMEEGGPESEVPVVHALGAAIVQIVTVDLVLSLDSIFTAVGVANDFPVMAAAIMVAIGIMLFASGPVSDFVNAHPTVKMLALAFILLVGVVLIADAFDVHIPRGYLYFAIFFSLGVESLNQVVAARRRRRRAG